MTYFTKQKTLGT